MKKIDEVHFHINNGGVTFSVIDDGHGPTIRVEQTHFAAAFAGMKLRTDADSLRKLGEMFLRAAAQPYSERYCTAPHGESEEDQRNARAALMADGGPCGAAPPQPGGDLVARQEACAPLGDPKAAKKYSPPAWGRMGEWVGYGTTPKTKNASAGGPPPGDPPPCVHPGL